MIRILLLGSWLLVNSSSVAAVTIIEESFTDYAGLGLSPGGGGGTLDSVQWQIAGASSGDSRFGEHTVLGDFARGLTVGGVRTGGIYAVSLPNDKRGLGVQATSSDFTPGALLWSLNNPTEQWLSHLLLSFELWWLNDGARSSTIDTLFSSDGLHWDLLASERTPLASDNLGWQFHTRIVPIGWRPGGSVSPAQTSLAQTHSIAPGAPFWLRWQFDDGTGGGSRDEFALTSLQVQSTPVLLNATPTLYSTLLAMFLLGAQRARSRSPGPPHATSSQAVRQISPLCNATVTCT